MFLSLKILIHRGILTFTKLVVRLFVLQLNTPVVPRKGSVTNGQRGIITLTLVISREPARPPVTRWLCVMNFRLFKVKTKLQIQVEEYIAWKKTKGVDACAFGTLSSFIQYIKKDSIEDIGPDDIQNYYLHINSVENARYFIELAMKDVRVMFRWFKARKYNVMEPDIIGNRGLTIALDNAIMQGMITQTKLGRPPKVALIQKVKSLRDINKLSFREISRVIRKDVSQVYVWYYYDLKKVPNLTKELSTG